MSERENRKHQQRVTVRLDVTNWDELAAFGGLGYVRALKKATDSYTFMDTIEVGCWFRGEKINQKQEVSHGNG